MIYSFNSSKKCLRILLQFIAVLNLQSFSTLAQQTQAPTSTISPSLSYGPTSYAPTPLPVAVLPPTPYPTYDFSVTPSWTRCEDTPDWRMFVGYDWETLCVLNRFFFCNDDKVKCSDSGTVGYGFDTDQPASEHCCKCKHDCTCETYAPTWFPGYPDMQDPYYPNEEDDDGPSAFVMVVIGVAIIICCLSCLKANQRSIQMQRALSSTRQTMSERRRQRLQQAAAGAGVGSSSTPPVDPNQRYEVILSKFYFQTVLPNKSNTNSQSLRLVEEEAPPQVQGGETTTIAAFAPTLPTNSAMSGNSSPSAAGGLSDRLASWRKPSSKDECCICLDGYHAGETICAAVISECNHVFHQECVVEWLQSNDLCPLCRVDLMKDEDEKS